MQYGKGVYDMLRTLFFALLLICFCFLPELLDVGATLGADCRLNQKKVNK